MRPQTTDLPFFHSLCLHVLPPWIDIIPHWVQVLSIGDARNRTYGLDSSLVVFLKSGVADTLLGGAHWDEQGRDQSGERKVDARSTLVGFLTLSAIFASQDSSMNDVFLGRQVTISDKFRWARVLQRRKMKYGVDGHAKTVTTYAQSLYSTIPAPNFPMS